MYPKIATVDKCVGCEACIQVCPKNILQPVISDDGFTIPAIINSNNCISCGNCERVCPVLSSKKTIQQSVDCYAAKSQNEEIRQESTSGGIFTEIAEIILDKGGVVFGATYADDFTVEHICVDNKADLYKLRGAKYSQSKIGDTFRNVQKKLKDGQTVLFSGTPCQVAGLKGYLGNEYENLVTVDFVCHGVPSPDIWKKYVEYRAKTDNNGELPKNINMRSKESGWSNYSYSIRFDYADKSYVAKNGKDIYMELFVKNYILRKSCYDCQFKGFDRVSDITLGDCWGIWEINPDFDDNKGTSLVLGHNEKANELLNTLCIDKISCLSDSVKLFNPSLVKSSNKNSDADKISKLLKKGKFKTVSKMFFKKPNILKRLIFKLFKKR